MVGAWFRGHVRGHGVGTGLGLRGAGLGLIMEVDRTGDVSQRLLFAMSNELVLLWLASISSFRSYTKVVRYAIEFLGNPSDRRHALRPTE